MSGERLPDFVLGGAMKAGTTTLHRLLARHPAIFIPEPELQFLCLDDITEQPDRFGPIGGAWIRHDFERDLAGNLDWYRSHFEAARADQLVGERSTVYLASAKAPARFARLLPRAKLVLLLRDPVARTYSHYWHRVRWGQAVQGFEATLRHAPHTLLTRSCYLSQLETWLRHVPRERILVLIFEELVRDTQRLVDEVCSFLGLPGSVEVGDLDRHRHRGGAPRLPRLLLLQNRLAREALAQALLPDLPGLPPPPAGLRRLGLRIDGVLRRANEAPGYPAMHADTRAFLEDLLGRENAGLSDLLGTDLGRFWPCLRRA